MGLVIMAHTEEAFREYFLPAVNNTDYSIILENDLFFLGKDMEVLLEVVGNQWSFVKTDRYTVKDRRGQNYFSKKLKNYDVLLLDMGKKQKVSLVIVEAENTFRVFRKYNISDVEQVEIGSYFSNHIQYNFQGYISRNHAILRRTQTGWILYDQSSNGTFIGAKRVHDPRALHFGDCIAIFGLRLVFLGNVLAVCDQFGDAPVQVKGLPEFYMLTGVEESGGACEPSVRFFKRSPRNMETLYSETVEIDAPPSVRKTKEKPVMMVIGPSFTMAIPMLLGSGMAILSSRIGGSSGGAYMFTGLVTALGSAVIGVFWALSNMKYNRQLEKEEQELRYNAYGQYLIEIAETLKLQYENNQRILNERYLSSEICCSYDENTPGLWNRNYRHEDFLAVRLGLGSMPFQVQIQIPKKKFELFTDDLQNKPLQLKQSYETLYQVPVCIDLEKKRLIGIVGGKGKKGAVQIMQNIVAQVAVNNCYTDVKMAFLYEKKTALDEKTWEFARWLPHVWTEDKKTRLIAENKKEAGDVGYELSKILRLRCEEKEEEKRTRPHYILFVDELQLLEGELLAKYALNPEEDYGLTTILMVEQYEELPNSCEDIIRNDENTALLYHVAESSGQAKSIEPDRISEELLNTLARRLSGIEVNETETNGEIPATLDFLEMYGIQALKELNVAERWTKNRSYDSMKALIGKKGGGANCYLDIHEKFHGPHGLIAGTTGSGKSETLQTYILSLAVNFSPYDIGFFIIDFKGGGMANLFSKLPHLIGQISNLSGNQVRRAMISIKSEINRRQRIFTENSVNNINLYTRLYKNGEASEAIPHLFIIIDEFAELKREEPEFMKELISVAQVGRSLGVHLILSTQKPAGTVDDNIWSNAKFRLCLRVQDRQDSNDMLHKPDAAYITQAGRGYLQVGNDEIYELFQSGYSGAVYEEDSTAGKGAIATMLTSLGRAAIVGNTLKKRKKENRKREWLNFLAGLLYSEAKAEGISVSELAAEGTAAEQRLKLLFEKIREAGYHFEESQANRSRIREFVKLLAMTEGMGEQQAAELACEYAPKLGIKLPETKETTQLEAVVGYLNQVAQENGYLKSMVLWLPVLPEKLSLDALKDFQENRFTQAGWPKSDKRWSLEVPVGMYDDPENQSQKPFVIHLSENGHQAVCGAVVTGKSTFLQTFVYALIQKYTPQWINLYLLDFSSHMLSCFEEAPHVGGIVYQEETEKTRKFFHMLDVIMNERKQLLKGGNYSQYVQINGVELPAVVVIIDNYATFREKTDNRYEGTLIRLSREGVGYGIYLVISAGGFGASEIPGRIGDNIRTVTSLEMGDRFKFAEVMRVARVEVLPEVGIKGRGLAAVEGRILEFQTAVAMDADNDYERSEKIKEQCGKMRQSWCGRTAARIPQIPEKPLLLEFAKTNEYRDMLKLSYCLPVAYRMDDATCFGIDLRYTYCYVITGKARTGKTNVLKNIIYAASQGNAGLCIIEGNKRELEKTAALTKAAYLTTDREIFDYFKDTIPVFKERNMRKRRLIEEGLEDLEIYQAMQCEKPIFIFLADVVSFVRSIYRKLENGAGMNGYLENITEKGSLHNIYFFGCIDTDEAPEVSGMKVYNNLIRYKTGMHLGGNVSAQKVFSFTNISFLEQSKTMKTGLGLVPSQNDASVAETIVIPHAKGV